MKWAHTFTVTSLLCQSGVDSLHGWGCELGVRVWETRPWGPQLGIPESLPACQGASSPILLTDACHWIGPVSQKFAVVGGQLAHLTKLQLFINNI